jgi:predicted branched-subunit amino acid permease
LIQIAQWAYLFWVIPCVAGALFGEYISNPQALGLDFAITAMLYEGINILNDNIITMTAIMSTM